MNSTIAAYCHTETCITNFKIEEWLPPGITLDGLIAVLAAMTVLLAIYAIWLTLRPATPYERRFTDIAERKDVLRRAALGPARRARQNTSEGLMSKVVQRLNLLRSNHATDARMTLAQAGFRSRDAMIKYLFARFSMPWLFGFVVLVDAYTLQLLPIPENLALVGALVGAGVGYIAPGYYIKNIVQKRAKKLTLALPDALDLMVICAEAGLALDASLTRVSRELAPTYPELAEELGLTAVELTFLPDRRQAFENLNARTNLPGIRGVVNTLLQTARYGTPLAQSLRVLAAEFREARITRAEEKAARLPAMMTVPMILFILPTLFIVLMGPAALNIIDTFSGKAQSGPQNVTVVEHTKENEDIGPQPGTVTHIQVSDETPMADDTKPMLVPTKTSVSMAEPVVVDVDARKLQNGQQLRVAVVPSGTLETDTPAMMRNSVPIQAAQLRVLVPPAAPGKNQIRLYYIPPFQSDFTVAARSDIDVTPGASGAVEASQLLRDAAADRAAFNAKYAGRFVTVEGQFLSAEPGANGALVVSIGWTEPSTTLDGAPSQVVCLAAADDAATARRVGSLEAGTTIVVQGSLAALNAAPGESAITLGSCKVAP